MAAFTAACVLAMWPAPVAAQCFARFHRGIDGTGIDKKRVIEAERNEAAIKTKLGTDNQKYLAAVFALADEYQQAYRYTEADEAYKRALTVEEKIFGPDHAELADDLCQLAQMYSFIGRSADAVALYQRELAIEQKTLRPDRAAQTEDRLAGAFMAAGRFAEAEQIYLRQSDLNGLLQFYESTGRYAEAELLLQQHLEADDTFVFKKLADLYQDMGQYAEAEQILRGMAANGEKKYAMLAYMNDPSEPRNPYPAYWAPFSVVGEGAGK